MKIERMFTVVHKLGPVWWGVCEVVPLFDADGRLLAYCEKGFDYTSGQLPTEIFNHEMMDIDPSDPCQMAGFMSKYGLLGPSIARRGHAIASILDVETLEDAARVDTAYDIYSSHCGRFKPYLHPDEGMLNWYLTVRDSLRREGYAELDRSCLSPYCVDYLGIATAEEAERSFRGLRLSGIVCGALAAFQDIGEIKAYLNGLSCPGEDLALGGEREVEEVIRAADAFLSECLAALTPKIGFVEASDDRGNVKAYRCSPPSYEEELAEQEEGCLQSAIAAQIYNFALDGSKCRVCEYCGRVFVEKYSPHRKGAPRVSTFCSDSCQQSKKQKRYRANHAK